MLICLGKKNVLLGIIQFFSLLQVSLCVLAKLGCPCRQDVLKLTELELVQSIVHLLSLLLFYFVSIAVSPCYVVYMLIAEGPSVTLVITVACHSPAT